MLGFFRNQPNELVLMRDWKLESYTNTVPFQMGGGGGGRGQTGADTGCERKGFSRYGLPPLVLGKVVWGHPPRKIFKIEISSEMGFPAS